MLRRQKTPGPRPAETQACRSTGTRQERILTWLMAVVVLLVSAFFVAQGVTYYAASFLWSPPDVRAGVTAQRSGRPRKDGRAILARNIFDSQTGAMPTVCTDITTQRPR